MATYITEECINCGACEPECPNEAISEGEDIYLIDPKLCTECVGFHDHEACQAVCPVECCLPNPKTPRPRTRSSPAPNPSTPKKSSATVPLPLPQERLARLRMAHGLSSLSTGRRGREIDGRADAGGGARVRAARHRRDLPGDGAARARARDRLGRRAGRGGLGRRAGAVVPAGRRREPGLRRRAGAGRQRIRTPEISDGASRVSALPEVRAALLELQRRIGAAGGVVVEGRDIGTVVFPQAQAKFFLTASADERARRRVAELRAAGRPADSDTTRAELVARDERDSDPSGRAAAQGGRRRGDRFQRPRSRRGGVENGVER